MDRLCLIARHNIDHDTSTSILSSSVTAIYTNGLVSLQTKIRLMGAMSHDCRSRVEERAKLRERLAEMRQERRRISMDLRTERGVAEEQRSKDTGPFSASGITRDTNKAAWAAVSFFVCVCFLSFSFFFFWGGVKIQGDIFRQKGRIRKEREKQRETHLKQQREKHLKQTKQAGRQAAINKQTYKQRRQAEKGGGKGR